MSAEAHTRRDKKRVARVSKRMPTEAATVYAGRTQSIGSATGRNKFSTSYREPPETRFGRSAN
jgi:hypothetical protein